MTDTQLFIHDRNAAKRVRSVMKSLMTEQPFFGSLCLKMELNQSAKVQTMAADGRTLQYNAEWAKESMSDEIKLAMARLVTACSLKHHTRRNDRDMETWQEASRQSCLPILNDAGYTDHETFYPDQTTEQIYDLIYSEKQDEEQQPNPQGDQDQQGEGGQGNSGGQIKDQSGMGTILDAPDDTDKNEESMQWTNT